MYKYYNTNMTGHRVSSSGSIDRLADSYGVVGSDRVRILVGNRQRTGKFVACVPLPNLRLTYMYRDLAVDHQQPCVSWSASIRDPSRKYFPVLVYWRTLWSGRRSDGFGMGQSCVFWEFCIFPHFPDRYANDLGFRI